MKLFTLVTIIGSLGVAAGFVVPTINQVSRAKTTPRSTKLNEKNNEDAAFVTKSNHERRDFLNLVPAVLIAGVSPLPALANEDEFTMYEDESVGFQIKRPSGWEQSEQKLPDRRRIVLFVNNKEDSVDKDLMFIAYTPTRDDFTSLASFGSVDQVAQMTILPKGQLAGVESESAMLSAESKKNSYYFDYFQKSPGQPKRHFKTIFSLVNGATGGAGSVLVTITVQTSEDKYKSLQNTFDEIIDSYGKIKK